MNYFEVGISWVRSYVSVTFPIKPQQVSNQSVGAPKVYMHAYMDGGEARFTRLKHPHSLPSTLNFWVPPRPWPSDITSKSWALSIHPIHELVWIRIGATTSTMRRLLQQAGRRRNKYLVRESYCQFLIHFQSNWLWNILQDSYCIGCTFWRKQMWINIEPFWLIMYIETWRF